VALQKLRQQFIDWRDTGRSGKRIPDKLWQAATDMARQVGVNRAAKASGLDYSKLKRPLNGGIALTTKSATAPDFVQLPMTHLIQTPQCVIEFAGDRGTQTMRLSGYDAATIVSLAEYLAGLVR